MAVTVTYPGARVGSLRSAVVSDGGYVPEQISSPNNSQSYPKMSDVYVQFSVQLAGTIGEREKHVPLLAGAA